MNNYDVYDELCKYWDEIMQDDAYMVSRDGWKVTVELPKDKKGNVKKSYSYADISCDLLPAMVLVEACMPEQLSAIRDLEAKIDEFSADMAAVEDENEETFINENGDIMKAAAIKAIVKAAKKDSNICSKEDLALYTEYIKLSDAVDSLKKKLKEETIKLTRDVQDKYADLNSDQIRQLVFTNKWMPAMRTRLEGLMQSAQQVVSSGLHTLNDRYRNTLSQLSEKVTYYEEAVMNHLKTMGL